MFTPNVTPEMRDKLATVGATPILDSEFLPFVGRDEQAEVVLTDKGYFISSPANDWVLAGPFDVGL